jgi:hypothetical protein
MTPFAACGNADLERYRPGHFKELCLPAITHPMKAAPSVRFGYVPCRSAAGPLLPGWNRRYAGKNRLPPPDRAS